jgi:hypothetical protein
MIAPGKRLSAARAFKLLAKHSPPMLVAHFVGDAGSGRLHEHGERRVAGKSGTIAERTRPYRRPQVE